MTSDEVAITRVLTGYYRAFSTLQVQAFLRYFHEPCLLVGPAGVFAAPNHAALEATFTPAIEELRAREYERSEPDLQQFMSLSPTAAFARGVTTRYKQNGELLERVGVTYVLHKIGHDWKIAVLIIHDTEEPGSSSHFFSPVAPSEPAPI